MSNADEPTTERARPLPGPGRAGSGITVSGITVAGITVSGITAPAARVLRPTPALIRATPELARVAATSAWHVFSWSVGATLAGANYVVQRAIEGEPATAIVADATRDLRGAARRVLGVGDALSSKGSALSAADGNTDDATRADLRRRGSDLLRRSNDVRVVEDTHPAFARILTEITPDEARILRFLSVEGPQPSVDVRTRRPFGIGSALVAENLTMLAEEAGCRDLDRTSQYLTNLSRLGLIDLSHEQVSNPQRYQVVEAQPYVAEAHKHAGRWPRTVHRSILLTGFGTEFVLTCLPIAGRVVEKRKLQSRDTKS